MRISQYNAPLIVLVSIRTVLSLIIDFYWQPDCTLYGTSCIDIPPDQCCGSGTNPHPNTYGAVLLSDLGGLTDVWTHVYSTPANDHVSSSCGHKITTQKHAQKCTQSLAMEITGAVVLYDPHENGPSTAYVGEDEVEGVVEARVAGRVFLRDGEVIYYMAMNNETRLAAWFDLVRASAKEKMLKFMLREHDRRHLAAPSTSYKHRGAY